jgi:hypothetical protein
MSFLYNYLFPAQLPDSFVTNHFQFLENGFQQCVSGTSANAINSATGTQYTAEQMMTGRFLVRGGTTTGTVNDTSASAANLVAYIKTLIPPFVLKPNFYVDIFVQNTTGNNVSLTGGVGVTSDGAIVVSAGQIATVRCFITGVEAGAESAYLSKLGN